MTKTNTDIKEEKLFLSPMVLSEKKIYQEW